MAPKWVIRITEAYEHTSPSLEPAGVELCALAIVPTRDAGSEPAPGVDINRSACLRPKRAKGSSHFYGPRVAIAFAMFSDRKGLL